MLGTSNNKFISFLLGVLLLIISILPSSTASANSTKKTEENIDQIIENMTLEEKIGQMFMPDFRNWGKDEDGNPIPFTIMNEEVAKIIQDYHLGGVILFRENVANTEQTVRLVHELQEASQNIPLLIAIDQEGGLVTRLQTGTNMPGNMALGAANDQKLAEEVGEAIGAELNSLGINVNFAPVLDVNVNPANPVIGIRSFGADPDLVSRMGVGYIKGLQKSKVAATAKHFPGHGDTATDSHFGLPIVDHDRKTLEAIDLKPFKTAMDNNIDMIMTAHIVVPALDDDKAISIKDGSEIGIPATLSKKILTGLIREEIHYDGVIVTDALNMQAITDHFGPEDAVIKSINAGADIVLMPAKVWNQSEVKNLDKIFRAVIEAVNSGKIKEEKIDKSVRRILTLKNNRNIIGNNDTRSLEEKINNAKAIVGSEKHKDIERRSAERAMTVIRNDENILPFNLDNGDKILLLSSAQSRLNLMELQMYNIIDNLGLSEVKIDKKVYDDKASLTQEDKKLINSADYIIMGTYNLNSNSKFPIETSKYTKENNKKLATISTRNPYDIAYLPDVKGNIAIYGPSGYDQTQQGEASLPINIPVGLDTIFGLVKPTGKLPVSIPKADASGNLFEIGHGLTYKPKVNKEELIEIITEAEKLDKNKYTEESWTVLKKALIYAKTIYDKENVTQEEVDEAIIDLERAINNLILKVNNDEAKRIIDLINELPPLNKITLEDKKTVELAREAYNNLTEKQQSLVTNLHLLEAAEKKIAELEEQLKTPEKPKKPNMPTAPGKKAKGSLPKTGYNNKVSIIISGLILAVLGILVKKRSL